MSEREIRHLIVEAQARSPESFVKALGRLVLLGRGVVASSASSGWRYVTEDGTRPASENPLGQLLDAVAYPIRKAGRNAFGRVVLIGRAESNDIRVKDASISKLHARIEIGEPDLVLSDASSRNGTFYDGVQLRGDRKVVLESGHTLRLGDVDLKVYDSVRLHTMLRSFRPT